MVVEEEHGTDLAIGYVSQIDLVLLELARHVASRSAHRTMNHVRREDLLMGPAAR